jgi:hypothetical protein
MQFNVASSFISMQSIILFKYLFNRDIYILHRTHVLIHKQKDAHEGKFSTMFVILRM